MQKRSRTSNFEFRTSGMTLVELLIVIAIIGVLISAVLVASTALIGRQKSNNTKAVLQIVADAVEQFKRSETEKPTITRNAAYKRRYGLYPPDELEVFTLKGVPATPPVPGSLGIPPRSVMMPTTDYVDMKYYKDSDCSDFTCQASEHRDQAAMIVAIESSGGAAAAILDRIADRNRSAGVLNATGEPAVYLDRPVGINGDPDGTWDAGDLQIRNILDDWGNEIGYLAQRDHPGHGGDDEPFKSSNMNANGNWNEASTELIRLNGGQPVIYSYGPDGKDQLKFEVMGDKRAASLVGDFNPKEETADNKEHIIDHPANSDNVYANDQLREKLAKGIPDEG